MVGPILGRQRGVGGWLVPWSAMALTVGVPTEIKNNESRVAITPDGVRELCLHGVTVLVEVDAGRESAIPDAEYVAAGASIVASAGPVGAGRPRLQGEGAAAGRVRPDAQGSRPVHVPSSRRVPDGGRRADRSWRVPAWPTKPCSSTAGALPLLAPMSEVAGRMATQIGAHYLERATAAEACCSAVRPACARPGRRSGCRKRRLELGVDRRRHGGGGPRSSTATWTDCASSTRSTAAGS